MAIVLNGTFKTPAESYEQRKVIHPQTSTDQVVINTDLIQEETETHGLISHTHDFDDSGSPTDDLTKVICNLANTGKINSNTVLATSQPNHSCIWIKHVGTPLSNDKIISNEDLSALLAADH